MNQEEESRRKIWPDWGPKNPRLQITEAHKLVKKTEGRWCHSRKWTWAPELINIFNPAQHTFWYWAGCIEYGYLISWAQLITKYFYVNSSNQILINLNHQFNGSNITNRDWCQAITISLTPLCLIISTT